MLSPIDNAIRNAALAALFLAPAAANAQFTESQKLLPPSNTVLVGGVAVDGDWAVVEFVNRGTHTGPLKSSLGTFEPTGRSVEVRYCSVMRVENGKVVEGRDYYDSATFLRQLVLLLPPADLRRRKQ